MKRFTGNISISERTQSGTTSISERTQTGTLSLNERTQTDSVTTDFDAPEGDSLTFDDTTHTFDTILITWDNG